MRLIQLTLDHSVNETVKAKSDRDYQTELSSIWEGHVKEDRTGVYVCDYSIKIEQVVHKREYRKKKEMKEAQHR